MLQKTTSSFLGRAVVFLVGFATISGIVGSHIIASPIFERDGFTIYGGVGKAAIFGVIAFWLLSKNTHIGQKVSPLYKTQGVWLCLSISTAILAWVGVEQLIAKGHIPLIVAATHASLLLSIGSLLIACFGTPTLRAVLATYKPQILLASLFTLGFYIFLQVVYMLWLPLAQTVLISTEVLLRVVHIATEVIPPNTLITDRFGVTIAQYCSGIESIALFTSLYAIVGILERHRLRTRRFFTLFPFALCGLFMLNIVRVSGLIAAGYYYDPVIAFSLFHSYAGLLFFVVYSFIFWGIFYKYILVTQPKTAAFEDSQTQESDASILITHVYSSDNKGDAALTSILLESLEQEFPRARFTILSLNQSQNSSGCTATEAPSFMSYALYRYHNPLLKLLYTLGMVTSTLAWAWWYSQTRQKLPLPNHLRRTAEQYLHADLIVPVGGGYLRSRRGLMNRLNIPLLLHPLLVGALLGKPTVLYTQSVGPFQNKIEEKMMAYVMKRMTTILIREDTSVALLAKLGVTDNVVRGVDAGFLLRTTQRISLRDTYHIPRKKVLIGVTVRSWLTETKQETYERAVAKALDDAIELHNAHVIFIPQVTAANGDDDRISSRRVLSYMRNQRNATIVDDVMDHHQIKAFYDDLDLLLGTRFHSVIFSLTSFIPVVAIEYEHKTSGIMRDLGLESWVVPIELVSAAKLSSLLQGAITNRNAYSQVLAQRIPPYQQRATQAIYYLRTAYDTYQKKPTLTNEPLKTDEKAS